MNRGSGIRALSLAVSQQAPAALVSARAAAAASSVARPHAGAATASALASTFPSSSALGGRHARQWRRSVFTPPPVLCGNAQQWRRSLCTPAAPPAPPAPPPRANEDPDKPWELDLEQAVGIGEAVLMYMENGIPGKELDKIFREARGEVVTVRLRRMLGVFLSTQIHVLAPFGFNATQESLEAYAKSQMAMAQHADKDSPLAEDLKRLGQDTWAIMLRRAFRLTHVPPLEIDQVRYAASKVSSNLQDPTFLASIDELYKSELRTMAAAGKTEEAVDKLQAAMLPCYFDVLREMAVSGLEPTDLGYVALQTHINQNMGDQVVNNSITSGIMAVNMKAPLQQGP